MHFVFTEFTAHVFIAPVTGCFPFTATTQVPQPPSKHINLVAVSWACSLMKVFKVISAGKVDKLTREQIVEIIKQKDRSIIETSLNININLKDIMTSKGFLLNKRQ